jgi:aspartyl-tRNA(Asn)/glutamyl-tRNA(Gln) amidotransferase subunit A
LLDGAIYSAFDNYFLQAQRVRQLIQDDFDRVFKIPNYFSNTRSSNKVETSTDSPCIDVLLHPSAIRTAPLLSESSLGPKSELSTYVQDVLTVPASLAGLPALSMPVQRDRHAKHGNEVRLPIGFSLVGQWGTDEMVLAVGKAIENLD